MGDWTRALTPAEQTVVQAAREKAYLLYEGKVTPHRSCGIAMAETFGRPTPAYQVLRRGGLTGFGPCGVLQGARMILGELLGDPDPTGPVTAQLWSAIAELEARIPSRMNRQAAQGEGTTCNKLTGQFAEFKSPERAQFCTDLSADIAALAAEVLIRNDLTVEIHPMRKPTVL